MQGLTRRRRCRRKIVEPETSSRCAITGERFSKRELVMLDHLHPALTQTASKMTPALHPDALISRREADRYRILYVEELLKQERGELTEIDKQVARVSRKVKWSRRTSRRTSGGREPSVNGWPTDWRLLGELDLPDHLRHPFGDLDGDQRRCG